MSTTSSYPASSPPQPLSTGTTIHRLQIEAETFLKACAHREQLLTAEDLKDLCADVVAAVWPRRDELVYPMRYLRKVARHRLIAFLREKRRRIQTHSEWEMQHRDERQSHAGLGLIATPEDAWGNRRAFVGEFLSGQDGHTRLIVHLRYEAKYSWQLIADVVGGSADSVRMKEHRFCQRTLAAWKARRGCPVGP